MNRPTFLVMLFVLSASLFVILRATLTEDSELAAEKADFFKPQPFGSWDGARKFLIEPGKVYAIPLRCKLKNKASLEAVNSGALDRVPLKFELVENPMAAWGVRSTMIKPKITEARYRVWKVYEGNVIHLLSLNDGMTAEEVGQLPKEEVIERYNRRQRDDREKLQPADIHLSKVTLTELHGYVVLYLPQGLPQIEASKSYHEHGGTRISVSSLGHGVRYESASLPKETILLKYFSVEDGRFFVSVGGYDGVC